MVPKLSSKVPLLVLVLPLLFFASATSPTIGAISNDPTVPDYWPTLGWRTSTPEAQGMGSGKLEEMHDQIEAQDYPLHSLVVVRHGYIVFEDYPSELYNENTLHILYSCTKSVTSALVGIAVAKGFIASVDSRIVDLFSGRPIANLDGRKQSMTLEHLLTMTAGFDWSDDVNFWSMQANSDWVQYVLDRPMAFAPGTVWVYNSGASHLLSAIVNITTPSGTLAFAQTNLFAPLGITNVVWLTDTQGVPVGGTSLFLTPRDMAKFGYLYLHNGKWDDTQIVPEAWVAASTETAATVYTGTGYGYQWWLGQSLHSFEARGYAGQYIVVIPEHDLVVVFTAYDLAGEIPWLSFLLSYIIPAIGDTTTPLPLSPWVSLLTAVIVGVPAAGLAYFFVHRRKRPAES